MKLLFASVVNVHELESAAGAGGPTIVSIESAGKAGALQVARNHAMAHRTLFNVFSPQLEILPHVKQVTDRNKNRV
jgi:hypothetical protein